MRRVLLDCDGVLSQFVEGWLQLLNDEYNRNWTPEDVTGWDVCASLGLNNGQHGPAKKLITNCPRFAAELDVCTGAVDGVRRLQRIADVFIVTSPWNSHPTWTFDREAWLRNYFGIRPDRIIHTSAKHVCVGHVLVDDRTDTCREWQADHPLQIAVQWITPHNRRDAWPGPSTNDWDELYRIVESVADHGHPGCGREVR